jgi:hypothetical protein
MRSSPGAVRAGILATLGTRQDLADELLALAKRAFRSSRQAA